MRQILCAPCAALATLSPTSSKKLPERQMKEAPRGRLLSSSFCSPDLAVGKSSFAPARLHRLIGHAGMMLAIRQRPARLATAEMKRRIAGIADRPVAHRFFQREDARPFRKRDDKLLEWRGLGVELSLVLRLERDIAARAEQRRPMLARHMCPPRS